MARAVALAVALAVAALLGATEGAAVRSENPKLFGSVGEGSSFGTPRATA